jgi:hypothetical protein
MTFLICFPIPSTVSPAFQLPLIRVAPTTLLSYIAHQKWSTLHVHVVLLQEVTNSRFHLWLPAPWVPLLLGRDFTDFWICAIYLPYNPICTTRMLADRGGGMAGYNPVRFRHFNCSVCAGIV